MNKSIRFSELLLDDSFWTFTKDRYYSCHDDCDGHRTSCEGCSRKNCMSGELQGYPHVHYCNRRMVFTLDKITLDFAAYLLQQAIGEEDFNEISESEIHEFYDLLLTKKLHGYLTFKDVKIFFDCSELMGDGGYAVVIRWDDVFRYKKNVTAWRFFRKQFMTLELFKEENN